MKERNGINGNNGADEVDSLSFSFAAVISVYSVFLLPTAQFSCSKKQEVAYFFTEQHLRPRVASCLLWA
jgi:hypothetical protein